MNLSQEQVGELIELLDKEEVIDVENKIQKALQKNMEQEKIAKESKKQKEVADSAGDAPSELQNKVSVFVILQIFHSNSRNMSSLII